MYPGSSGATAPTAASAEQPPAHRRRERHSSESGQGDQGVCSCCGHTEEPGAKATEIFVQVDYSARAKMPCAGKTCGPTGMNSSGDCRRVSPSPRSVWLNRSPCVRTFPPGRRRWCKRLSPPHRIPRIGLCRCYSPEKTERIPRRPYPRPCRDRMSPDRLGSRHPYLIRRKCCHTRIAQ